LLVDQLVYLRVAVTVQVLARTAAVKRIEDRVGIGPALRNVESDGIVLAPDLGIIDGGVDGFELAVEIYFF